ncbi:MAG: hypothetical protein AAF648_17010 [Pseudomonadota bacterium]
MAEQDFTDSELDTKLEQAFDQSDSATEDHVDASLATHLERLEARFQDAYLDAANDDAYQSSAAPYPADAFFRACERHLRYGTRYAEEAQANDGAPQDGEPAATIQDAPSADVAPRSRRKGPSYAL